jgi:hypothetical protein
MNHIQVDFVVVRRKVLVLNAEFLCIAAISFLALLCSKTTTTATTQTQSLTHSCHRTRKDDKITDSHRTDNTIILPHRNTKQHKDGNTKVENPQHGTKKPNRKQDTSKI